MYNQHHPKAKAIPVFRHLVTAKSIARQSKARQGKTEILCEPSNSRVYHTTIRSFLLITRRRNQESGQVSDQVSCLSRTDSRGEMGAGSQSERDADIPICPSGQYRDNMYTSYSSVLARPGHVLYNQKRPE